MRNTWSYLTESREEAVDVIPGRARVQSVFVFLYFFHCKLSKYYKFVKGLVMFTWQPLHKPREDIVQL